MAPFLFFGGGGGIWENLKVHNLFKSLDFNKLWNSPRHVPVFTRLCICAIFRFLIEMEKVELLQADVHVQSL